MNGPTTSILQRNIQSLFPSVGAGLSLANANQALLSRNAPRWGWMQQDMLLAPTQSSKRLVSKAPHCLQHPVILVRMAALMANALEQCSIHLSLEVQPGCHSSSLHSSCQPEFQLC